MHWRSTKKFVVPLLFIGAHLVPTIKDWENKRTKHILGVEDKRKIMMVVSSTTKMVLFTFQIVFEQVLFITIC